MQPTNHFPLLIICILMLFSCHRIDSKSNPPDLLKEQISCIEKVIGEDGKLGAIRNHECEKIPLSETITKYVKGMESLDFSSCPDNFTKAFQSHILAWKEMIPITDNYKEVRGEMHNLFKELENSPHAKSFKSALDNIWSSWAEVEKSMNK